MKQKIDCYVPFVDSQSAQMTVNALRENGIEGVIYLLATPETKGEIEGCVTLEIDGLTSTATMKAIADTAATEYILFYTKSTMLRPVKFALNRMVEIANDTNADMLYADHFQDVNGEITKAPVIDYQFGALRDDFDFGSLLMFRASAFKVATYKMTRDFKFAGLYDLRLKISQVGEIVHINEFLYTDVELDNRKSGEKMFDYVDPRNRGRQIEMEEACTDHLKAIGGYLAPVFKHIEFNKGEFDVEASIIIPVRNRIRTIRDAVKSALSQVTDFKFNVIVVDNFSNDGTREAIDEFADDPRLIHVIADYYDFGIGGYWNLAAHHPQVGKFMLQLDSDDLYSGTDTLAKVVKAFYEQNCGMVVGTYRLTDINQNEIAPGVIDHKEWTPENGRNNALRINGLGAPRAFYTPLLREIQFPNVSYGEDYAEGLYISRKYQIGRIYDVIYNCRRWDDNSDASLDVEKMNRNNTYKDRIRTWELQARIAQNKK